MAERGKEDAGIYNNANASRNTENGTSSVIASVVNELMTKMAAMEAAAQKQREENEKAIVN